MNQRPPDVVMGEIQRAGLELRERGQDLLSWEWDGRLGAVLAVVKAPRHHRVLSVIESVFPDVWDSRTVRQASERIITLSDAWGGLRPGQKLLTFDPADDPLLFATWWPWGGGTTFSLRISCHVSGAEAEALDPLAVLRARFGI